jgi:hypothetical protein
MSWNRILPLLLAVFVLGALLRFSGLGTNSLVADEFLDMNSAYGYSQTGRWQAWDFNFGRPSEVNENAARDERAALYKFQVAALFSVLPPTETVARSVSVLWGIFAILVVFWAARIFTGKLEIGLLAAFLCAVSVSAILYSRRLRMYAMLFPVYLVFATTAFAFYEREYRGRIALFRNAWERFGVNVVYALPLLLSGGLALSLHQLAGHLPLSLGSYLAVSAWFAWRSGKGWRNKYGVSLLLGFVGLGVLLVMVPHAVKGFTQGLVFFDDHVSYFRHVLADFATPGIGAVLIAFGGWYLARREGRMREAGYLAATFLLPLLMAVFLWRRNVGPQYIFFIQSFAMIFAATGVFGLVATIRERFPDWGKRGTLGGLLLLALLVPHWGYFLEENNTYHETSTGGNPNYRKVFAYFKKEQLPTDALITRNFRNYYWSGAHVPVYDFGGELSTEKLSLTEVQKVMTEHPTGWLIYSGNDEDYISNEVEIFAEKNMERVSNSNVRGDITVFRWESEKR